MTSLVTLAGSELRRLFRQPLSWFILALAQGAMALWFFLLLVRYLEHADQLRRAGVSIEVMVRYFAGAYWSVMLIAPILTMGVVAGDRQSGMLRFFYTTPISSTTVVMMKLIAVLALALAYLLLVALLPVTLLWGAPIDLGLYAGNVIGLGLFCTFHICLGIACSALTRTPVASALLALALSLGLWFADWASRLDSEATTINAWSSLTRLRGFNQGLLVSADIGYFVVGAVAFTVVGIIALGVDRRLS